MKRFAFLVAAAALTQGCAPKSGPSDTTAPALVPESVGGAYLQVSLDVADENRAAAAGVYLNYLQPFLDTVPGAESKTLLVRDEDVQVLHGFETLSQAQAYLNHSLFTEDVVSGLAPLLSSEPEIRVYDKLPVAALPAADSSAYLEITLDVAEADREAAAGVYLKYREPFIEQIPGAQSKDLVIRAADVQVLHGFASVDQAQAYLESALFAEDVVTSLSPYLRADPEVRIYEVFRE